MKARLIMTDKSRLPVRRKCHLAELPKSTYYASQDRLESKRERRNRYLLVLIGEVFARSERLYGSRRVHAELRKHNIKCGHNRVARLMKKHGLAGVQRRAFRVTTNSEHDHPIAANRLGRDFRVSSPNRVYVADISYIPTEEGWLYLATEMDLFSHRIVGWSLSGRLTRDLALAALQMAVGLRRPVPGLIHHSDQGVQYACGDFQRLLARHQMLPSMSRRGNPYDNAVAESFFRTLKMELIYRRRFRTRQEAKAAIVEYIELFYNRRRLHSSLGYLSPVEYEELANAA